MRPSLAALSLLPALSTVALGQDWTFDVQPGASSSQVSLSLGADLPGTLRGDYDAVDNPAGTKTLPGLFGGTPTDNVPVSAQLGLTGSTALVGAPEGSFGLSLDGLGGCTIDGLTVDLLAGQAGSIDLTLGLGFDTFRTFDPDSLYIGGFPIDLPIGALPVQSAVLEQVAPGIGTAQGTPTGATQIDVLIPVALTVELDLQGNSFGLGPLPLLLPLTGALTDGPGGTSLAAGLSLAFNEVVDDPLGGQPLVDLPLALPTILPPGSTANLLLDLVLAQLTGAGSVDLTVLALGGPACGADSYCSAVPNSTGVPAQLGTTGATSVGEMGFTVTDLPLSQYGMLLASLTPDSVPQFGGIGTLCLGGNIVAFTDQVQWSRGVGSVSFGVDWNALPGGLTVQPGDTVHFQYWFRDWPAGGGTNFSLPLEVTFCP